MADEVRQRAPACPSAAGARTTGERMRTSGVGGGGPPLQRGVVLASDGLFKTRAAARRDVTAAQRAAQGVPKSPQPTVVTALLSMALTTLSTQLNSRLGTALLSTALTTLSAQLNSRLVTALLSMALTTLSAGKTKAQGVCSEPRSPTKSPRALGSSKEHSMRMGGIPSAPLTNPLALGGGRSAPNCAPRRYH